MTQEHLEAFMLMSVEKKILAKLDNKDIIDIRLLLPAMNVVDTCFAELCLF